MFSMYDSIYDTIVLDSILKLSAFSHSYTAFVCVRSISSMKNKNGRLKFHVTVTFFLTSFRRSSIIYHSLDSIIWIVRELIDHLFGFYVRCNFVLNN